jgi:hypothetical protein
MRLLRAVTFVTIFNASVGSRMVLGSPFKRVVTGQDNVGNPRRNAALGKVSWNWPRVGGYVEPCGRRRERA